MQHTSADHTPVCTLASLNLPAFVLPNNTFDLENLRRVTSIAVRNTDKVLDLTEFPTDPARATAEQTRPIGIGVQGLADVFRRMTIVFDSPAARELSTAISETIYHAALEASVELAKLNGPYPAFSGSPAETLELQHDMWQARPTARVDYERIRQGIRRHGLRNSVLTAQMPTATTSLITGSNDSVDPYIRLVTRSHSSTLLIDCQ